MNARNAIAVFKIPTRPYVIKFAKNVARFPTQNIHHLTIADFRELLERMGVRVEDSWFFAGDREVGSSGANWRAEYAVFQLSR